MQSSDQANQPSLIHDHVGERSHPAVIGQHFNMGFGFAKPVQPGVIRLTKDFDLISILRIQTNALRHICFLGSRLRQPENESQDPKAEHDISAILKLFAN
jgi:hypothetical protein